MKTTIFKGLAICLVILISSIYNAATAQVDTSQVANPDTTIQEKGKEEKKDDKKRKDEFIVYTGVNFNQLAVSSSEYGTSAKAGFHLGFNYKRGKFFYWQVGARFNNAVYELDDLSTLPDSAESFSVRGLDVPITGGINFLSAVNRIVALRLFVSAVPSFTLGIGENSVPLVKDDLNKFILYGQAGLGVNVAFIVIEAGYNYGFQDLIKDKQSKPGQVFINLGFRF